MLLRAVALDGIDVDVLSEWHTFAELKRILTQRLAVVDPVGLDAFFGRSQRQFTLASLSSFGSHHSRRWDSVRPGCRLRSRWLRGGRWICA